MDITLSVPDIHCGHCKSSIEGALSGLEGVERAEVTIDARSVDVTYDGSAETRNAIVAAIEEQGYAVVG